VCLLQNKVLRTILNVGGPFSILLDVVFKLGITRHNRKLLIKLFDIFMLSRFHKVCWAKIS
jgi:hypothetical protein